jgi:hypothetical protein
MTDQIGSEKVISMTPISLRLLCKLVLVSFLLAFLTISPAMAALNIVGSKFMGDVAPGQTVTFPMTLSVASTDSAADLELSVLGFANGPDGRYQGLDPAQDTSQYTARPMITLDKTSVHIAPGGQQIITATIKVPSNTGTGGRYALINIHTKPLGGGAVALVTAINVPVMVTLKGTQITETGTIESTTAGEVVQGKPVVVTTTFVNTGNHDFYGVKNEITVTDASGKSVAQASTVPLISTIIPGGKINFVNTINADLNPGTYTVLSRMIHSSGTVLATKSTAFTTSSSHATVQNPVSITLVPENPAILATTDGNIRIQFPKGSVLGATNITLTPSPAGTLPSAPQGMQYAKTTFAVEGFTGLLSHDATVTVHYTPDDLTSAGGNAKKLALARWDQSPGTWAVLPTTVDSNANTLTTTTNRFSTWAVVVNNGGMTSAAGANSPAKTTYAPLSVITVILALAGVFFIFTIKRRI